MSNGSGVNEALIREVVEQVLNRLDGVSPSSSKSNSTAGAAKRV